MMNKNPQKQRMNMQLNQIRSILNDFRKTKYKCVQLAQSMNTQMPNDQHFKNVQKTTLRKMDLLDITGLVSLKNQLVRALTDLFQIQRQLRYKKEKFDARKQIMQAEKQQIQYIKKNQVQSALIPQSPRQNKPILFDTNVRSIVSEPKKQQPQASQQKPKNKNLQIPLYRAKNQTNQNKLDRISKYIASLKRNMKLNSQTLGYKWKIKEFLLQDVNYIKLKTELQKYMMRQQQLDYIMTKAVQRGVQQYMKKAELIQSNSEYKIIKVYKNNKKQYSSKQSSLNISSVNKSQLAHSQSVNGLEGSHKLIQSNNLIQSAKFLQQTQTPHDLSMNSPKLDRLNESSLTQQSNSFNYTSPLKKLSSRLQIQFKSQIQQKAQQDFNSIKKQLQKSNQNYKSMINKINQTVEKGSQKLIQLRQKRKKKFQTNDDIWDQLDKI